MKSIRYSARRFAEVLGLSPQELSEAESRGPLARRASQPLLSTSRACSNDADRSSLARAASPDQGSVVHFRGRLLDGTPKWLWEAGEEVEPVRIFESVDLPAPFSPRSAWISPGSTSKSTPSFATTPGNRLLIPLILTAAAPCP